MTVINASPGRVLQLGYESEDNVTQIIFHYDEGWLSHGDGVFKIRVLRHGDTEAYNATEVIDDRESMTLTMTVTDIELSVKGHGEMQVVYIGNDFVMKSPIYRYNVSRAIDSEVVNPPSGSIINELVQSVGDLDELTTTNKDSLVEAINEVNAKEGGGGGSITVDDELSETSENPVQNKVIKARFDGIDQTLAGKASTDVVTQSTNGLMSAIDKAKLDTVGSVVTVSGTTPTITALSGVRYVSEGLFSVVSGYPKMFDSRNYDATEQNPNGNEEKALSMAKSAYLAQLSTNYANANANRVMMVVTLERADGRQIMRESIGQFPDMTPTEEN